MLRYAITGVMNIGVGERGIVRGKHKMLHSFFNLICTKNDFFYPQKGCHNLLNIRQMNDHFLLKYGRSYTHKARHILFESVGWALPATFAYYSA